MKRGQPPAADGLGERGVGGRHRPLSTDAQMTIRWFDQGPLEFNRSGQLFFQPLEFHLEPADLLVKFGLDRLALVVVAAASVAEQRFDAVQELFLPLTDLDGVDLIPS
jgi:hypothetical protein